METPTQIQPTIARWRRAFRGNRVVAEAHPLDVLIASLSRRSKMFSRGWGDEAFLARLWGTVSDTDPPCSIAIDWRAPKRRGTIARRDGTFTLPLTSLPRESTTVHVRAWLRQGNRYACVILAGYTMKATGCVSKSLVLSARADLTSTWWRILFMADVARRADHLLLRSATRR